MVFELRIAVPETSPTFRASAEAFLLGRVVRARAAAPARAAIAADILLSIDLLRAEGRERRGRALALVGARFFPREPFLILEAGRAQLERRHLAAASAALGRLQPGDILVDARAGALKAACAAAGRRDDEARALMAKFAIVSDPVVEHDLGRAAFLLGDGERAVHHFRRARGLAPRWPTAGIALADTLVAQGKLADAEAVLAETARSGDEDARVEMHSVALDLLLGATARSEARLSEARVRWTALREARQPRALACHGLRAALAAFAARSGDTARLRELITTLAPPRPVDVDVDVTAPAAKPRSTEPDGALPVQRPRVSDTEPVPRAHVPSTVFVNLAAPSPPDAVHPVVGAGEHTATAPAPLTITTTVPTPAAAPAPTPPAATMTPAAATTTPAPAAPMIEKTERMVVKPPTSEDDLVVVPRGQETDTAPVRPPPRSSDEQSGPASAAADWSQSRVVNRPLPAPAPPPARWPVPTAVAVAVAAVIAWLIANAR